MSEAIIATNEEPRENRRHPWRCPWKLVTEGGAVAHACNTFNRASDSHCQRCGRPYAQDQDLRGTANPGNHLAERLSLSEAVHEWEELSATVRQLFAQLHAIEQRAGVLFLNQTQGIINTISLHSHGYHAVRFDAVDDVLGSAEREIWSSIAERSGIFRVMSNSRATEVRKQLEREELPKLTPQNVSRWLENAQGNAEQLLREKIEETYNWLRPRTSYKTNSPFELGKKVIIEYVVDKADPRWTWVPKVNHHKIQQLASLETLFKTLDGKGQCTTGWKSDLQQAIEAADPEDSCFETAYFRGKVFRNGNMHLEFKRSELVAKLNALAGGRNLKGNRRAA